MVNPLPARHAVTAFLSAETLVFPGFWIAKSTLYHAFEAWSADAPSHMPVSKKGFGMLVKELRPDTSSVLATKNVELHHAGHQRVERPYCWVGLRLVWPYAFDPFEEAAAEHARRMVEEAAELEAEWAEIAAEEFPGR